MTRGSAAEGLQGAAQQSLAHRGDVRHASGRGQCMLLRGHNQAHPPLSVLVAQDVLLDQGRKPEGLEAVLPRQRAQRGVGHHKLLVGGVLQAVLLHVGPHVLGDGRARGGAGAHPGRHGGGQAQGLGEAVDPLLARRRRAAWIGPRPDAPRRCLRRARSCVVVVVVVGGLHPGRVLYEAVPAEVLVHLEHVRRLAGEDGGQRVVQQDAAPVLGVLQVVLLDVGPQPLHHLRPGQAGLAQEGLHCWGKRAAQPRAGVAGPLTPGRKAPGVGGKGGDHGSER
ncbi:hypothetical protein F751_0673 [Auxenochlorella protothecoides]|uniref:Uncharacterized protein n=1 Tax=Auxenochlorella protothecoides TaxID=3075 RepID=A0A087SQI3_AUXPR|nr:hypothetical protein F751_0673 [Auxenochlorella protothecoides]KFM27987.1 hypothetical protein F751_0673 [Auxenochlorella protothecoides]